MVKEKQLISHNVDCMLSLYGFILQPETITSLKLPYIEYLKYLAET